MNIKKQDIEKISRAVIKVLEAGGFVLREEEKIIPIDVFNRHIHLCRRDFEACFGKGYTLNPEKNLSQANQFAAEETLEVMGPKGHIGGVAILGPLRSATQVELLNGDNPILGTKAPLRLSGDIAGSESLTLKGPKGSVTIIQGAIVPQRHIHMTLEESKVFGVRDGQIVDVKVSGLRGGVYNNVVIRTEENSALAFHIDIEEANAMAIGEKSKVKIIKG